MAGLVPLPGEEILEMTVQEHLHQAAFQTATARHERTHPDKVMVALAAAQVHLAWAAFKRGEGR